MLLSKITILKLGLFKKFIFNLSKFLCFFIVLTSSSDKFLLYIKEFLFINNSLNSSISLNSLIYGYSIIFVFYVFL